MTDPKAQFVAFYRDTYSLVVATCERRLHDHGAAEDAAAEVFRVAWQAAQAGQELTLPWVYGVVRNTVGNEYRRSGRASKLLVKMKGTTPRNPGESLDHSDLRTALLQLPDIQRELLFMAYWEDLSGAQMSEILGISQATLWVRLSRARAALKQALVKTEEVRQMREGVSEHG